MALTLELTLSTSGYINEARTFRRLIPPNENAATIINRCMNSAVRIVNEANATLSPAAEFTPTEPTHEILSHNKENNAKLNLLVQSVFGTADRIFSKWTAIAEGAKDEESEKSGTGGGENSIG